MPTRGATLRSPLPCNRSQAYPYSGMIRNADTAISMPPYVWTCQATDTHPAYNGPEGRTAAKPPKSKSKPGSPTGTGPRARGRHILNYDACYNCGQQGHFASSCPLGIDITPSQPASRNPPKWKPPPRLPADEQAAINTAGVALCRQMLAERHT